MKELREMINSSFYGNENDDNIINIDEDNKIKIKEVNIKRDLLNKKEKKDDNVLIFKTPPNKVDIGNQEYYDDNIMKNMDINGIQRNLKSLFEQRIFA